MSTLAGIIRQFPERDKTAIVSKTGFRTLKYSYRELHWKILKAAALLQSEGIKKGDRAIIWAPNSPEWGAFFLACTLTGIIAVPIDAHASSEYINRIQQRAKARIIFQTKYRPKLLRIKTLLAEEFEGLLEKGSGRPRLPRISEADVAELLYTSGTTSEPKGVVLTHGNLASNVDSVKNAIKLGGSHNMLSILPLSHAFEQTNGFLLPLSTGATIIYMRTIKPSAIIEAIRQEKVSVVLAVPRVMAALEKNIKSEMKRKKLYLAFRALGFVAGLLPFKARKYLFFPIHLKFGRSLNFFGVGGAPFDRESENFWSMLGFTVLQGYGLTEASPTVSFNTQSSARPGSAGKPIPGVHVLIDEKGEILVKGPNVTPGYYKDGKKTLKNGWLRTGDLGSIDRDGFLFIRGRSKDVIITAEGMNVHPEDVEAALNKANGVKDSSVIGVKGEEGEKVHAFIITDLDQTRLQAAVANANSRLMSHQQIASYEKWPQSDFPRTTTMKVRKNILREYAGKKGALKPHHHHNTFISIIAETANVPEQDITPEKGLAKDLHMGSIERVELVSRLEAEFNTDIDEAAITGTTTVAEVEKRLTERKTAPRLAQREWTRKFPAKQLRLAVQRLLTAPILKKICKPELQGAENLQGLTGPALFVANHSSHYDAAMIMTALPKKFGERMCPAAWGEFHKTLLMRRRYALFEILLNAAVYNAYTILGNAYMFEQMTRPLQSMQYTGKLLDQGWNVLIFPEGGFDKTGEPRQFKQGIGVLASELMAPIVPVKIEGLAEVFPKGCILPRRKGNVKVKIGKPISNSELKGLSHAQAARKIEEAVRKL